MVPPKQETAAAVELFKQDHPGWSAEWHATSSLPILTGPGIGLSGVTAWDESTDPGSFAAPLLVFLDAHQQLLGSAGLTPTMESSARVGNALFYRFRWKLADTGIAVSGRADLAIHRAGKLVMISNHLPPGLGEVRTQPTITTGRAHEIVRDLPEVAETEPPPQILSDPQLLIWWDEAAADPAPPRLVYQVDLDRPTRIGRRILLDASTGAFVGPELSWRETGRTDGRSRGVGRTTPVVAMPAPRPAANGQVVVRLRAVARTGHAANGRVDVVPMVGVQVDPVGLTDENGEILVPPLTNLTTKLLGDYCREFVPPTQWQRQLLAGDGPIVDWLIQDSTHLQGVVHQATFNYWVRQATDFLEPRLVDPARSTTALARLGRLKCIVEDATSCHAAYAEIGDWIRFGRSSGTCRSFMFGTIILHELGHVIDYAYDRSFGSSAVTEAYADIVAMLIVGEPEVGERFEAGNTSPMRTGENDYHRGDSTSPHGHDGEHLVGFAWDAYLAFATEGLGEFATNLLLNLAAVGPFSELLFVRAIMIAGDDDGVLGNSSPHEVWLDAARLRHGI